MLKFIYANIDVEPDVPDQSWAMTRGWRKTPHRAASCILNGDSVVVVNCYENADMTFTEFVRGVLVLQPKLATVGVLGHDVATRDVLRRCGLASVTQRPMAEGELVVPAQVEHDLRWKDLIRCAARGLSEAGVVYI